MTDPPAQRWRLHLGGSLLAARKDRDATRIAALRSALSGEEHSPEKQVPKIASGPTLLSQLNAGQETGGKMKIVIEKQHELP